MEDKRNLLIGKAIELFAGRGLISVTMDEVAKSAGMSKKTAYQCFSSKTVLVEMAVASLIAQAKSIIRSNTELSDDPVQELVLQRDLFRHLIALRNVLNEMLLKRFPRAQRALIEFKSNYLKVFIQANLSDGIARGLYRAGLDIVGTSAIYISVADFYLFHNPMNQNEIFEALQLFINGIITNAGRRLFMDHTT